MIELPIDSLTAAASATAIGIAIVFSFWWDVGFVSGARKMAPAEILGLAAGLTGIVALLREMPTTTAWGALGAACVVGLGVIAFWRRYGVQRQPASPEDGV